MSLSHYQLYRIETGLRADPQLAEMLGIFGKLSAGTRMRWTRAALLTAEVAIPAPAPGPGGRPRARWNPNRAPAGTGPPLGSATAPRPR
jgi:hypothetical protein